MKTKKKAVCIIASRTAGTRELNYCKPFYQQDRKLSSLKEQIGQLLLYLQRPLSQDRQKQLWRLFESNLRQYYAAHRILPDPSFEGVCGCRINECEQKVVCYG